LNYNWHWQVFWRPSRAASGTYLHYLLIGLGWTLATALAAWVIALAIGALVGTLRTTPLKWQCEWAISTSRSFATSR